MNITNFTIADPNNVYIPTQEAADWCIQQQVTHWHNLEVNSVMIVVFAWLLLIAEEWLRQYNYIKVAEKLRIFSRALLLIFFFVYFYVIQYRIL